MVLAQAVSAAAWGKQHMLAELAALSTHCRPLCSLWPGQQVELLRFLHRLGQWLQPQHGSSNPTTAAAASAHVPSHIPRGSREASMPFIAPSSMCLPAVIAQGQQQALPWATSASVATGTRPCQQSSSFSSSAPSLWAQVNTCVNDTSSITDSQHNSSSQLPASLHLTPTLEARLVHIAERYAQIERMLSGQHTADSTGSGSGSRSSSFRQLEAGQQMAELQREYGSLQSMAELWMSLCSVRKEMSEVESLTQDADAAMSREAHLELQRLVNKARGIEEQLLLAMLPRMGDDSARAAIVEVRAGAGGAEASLFAKELFDMYACFAASKGWRCEVLDTSESDLGGVRTASMAVSGAGAYQQLRWEAGVHRVQRVPVTETQGRLHTSTASVVVLPEADEVEVHLKESDLEIQAYRASGPGGQHVNTTATAVRITHLPTGIVVTCQDERSQLRNKERALRVLRARVLAAERTKASHAQDQQRKAQAGTADRNERVRTYNFSQDRLTDHRVGITQQGLAAVMDGRCGEVLDEIHAALQLQEQTQLLEKLITEG